MTNTEPTRDEIDRLQGPALLEFGASWCGWCSSARPLIERALAQRQDVRHIKVEDGKGQPLGRSFAVKLWPTLVFLQDGSERARLVRPGDAASIEDALAKLTH